MAIEECAACERIIDLDWNCEGSYDTDGKYYCLGCIEKNGWIIDEHTYVIIKDWRGE